MGVHTYAHINLQATSQLTPAEYNSDPQRQALLNTHAKCFSPCSWIYMHAYACACNMRIRARPPPFKKKKEGGWCIPKWMQKADKRGDAVKCTEVVRESERTVSGGREVL